MGCDVCGKNEPLVEAIVEGSRLRVCKNCGKFGKIMNSPALLKKPVVHQKKEEILIDVVADYAKKIRDTREKLGLTQKEFAKKINEKETILSKIENGTQKPTLDLAKKLEHLLKIKLVEEVKEELYEKDKKTSGTLTIGDILIVKCIL